MMRWPDSVGVTEGEYCYELAQRLFPICRSITGAGVRETLALLKQEMPDLSIQSIPSGTKVLDWTVPEEWNIRGAFIEDEVGNRVVDFADNNLHIVGYSVPVDEWLSLDELQSHLYSLPDQPTAIPYVTSYYSRRWGFCLSEDRRRSLKPGRYHVVVDATLGPGVLNYGELLIRGGSNREIFLSTYICHPSMANNELSGPLVTTALARMLAEVPDRRFSYRIVFIPETIGSISYLSTNIEVMKQRIFAGFNISCVGDDRSFSYLPSRDGDTISDRVAMHVLHHLAPGYRRFSWLDRGSDERQYCAPGVDLPIASIMRTKYGEYPEYHTSLDDLSVISPTGLSGAITALARAIEVLENDLRYQVSVLGEPQMGRRGLYPTLSQRGSADSVAVTMNLISYCDGRHSLLDIAEILDRPMHTLLDHVAKLVAAELLVQRPA